MSYSNIFEDLLIKYIKASYNYYVALDAEPIMTDYQFDNLCSTLLQIYSINEHPMKHLTDESALRAGTGYQITKEQYEEFFDWLETKQA